MSLFFILSSLNLAVKLFSALVFFVIGWLALDSFVARRDSSTGTRMVGFMLMAAVQLIGAFQPANDLVLYFVHSTYLVGLSLVALSYIIHQLRMRSVATLAVVPIYFAPFALAFASLEGILLLIIAGLAYRQFSTEHDKSSAHLSGGFALLAVATMIHFFAAGYELSALLIGFSYLLELAAMIILFSWVWKFLAFRMREEIVIIFIAMALMISTIVTVAFSTILIKNVADNSLANLTTSVKVMDLVIAKQQEEALAKVGLIADDDNTSRQVADADFSNLYTRLAGQLSDHKLDFLIVTDEVGQVVQSLPQSHVAGDSFRQSTVGQVALFGEKIVTIDRLNDQLAVMAAAPLMVGDRVVGMVVGGFLLDNSFVAQINDVTNLESSIYYGAERVASTEKGLDGVTSLVGISETNKVVLSKVLTDGENVSIHNMIDSRPYLTSYLPLRDADNQIIGMLSASQSEQSIINLAARTNQLTFLIISVLLLIMILPLYLVTRRLT